MWNTKGVGVDGSSDKEVQGNTVPAVMLHADQDLGSSSLTAWMLFRGMRSQSSNFGRF
jgi:hypothetical protein